MNQTPPTRPTLEYGTAPSKLRKWTRRAVRLMLVLVFGLICWRWGPTVWRKGRILYFQHQCTNYTAPADLVVYAEEPTAAAKLLAGNSQYVGYRRSSFTLPKQTVTAAAYVPPCWSRLSSSLGVSGAYAMGMTTPSQAAIVFLHERTSPAGHHRLVCVRYFPDPGTYNPAAKPEQGLTLFMLGYNYDTFAFTTGSWTTKPIDNGHGQEPSPILDLPIDAAVECMYAGQVDPNDASHFTIRFKLWNKAGTDTLDGYLADNDNVVLKGKCVITRSGHG